MQKRDKILLSTLVPIGIIIVAVAIAVGVTHCEGDSVWSTKQGKCRKKCRGERKEHGERYDPLRNTCTCPAEAPTWSEVLQQCVGVCTGDAVWDVATQKCVTPPVTCTPLPSVDSDTGVILNNTHFPRPAGTCGAGAREELVALCVASPCTDGTQCVPGDRWDGYDVTAAKCVKTKDCSTVACDAAYCVSDTIRQRVGRIYQVTTPTGCKNPSEADVAEMCIKAGSTAYVSPNCLSAAPRTDMEVNVVSATTDGITGSISHSLVNGSLDLNAQGELSYTYSLKGVASTASGVTLTGKCHATNPTRVCATFTINNLPPDLQPGTYDLTVVGYPAWDPTLPLFTLPSAKSIVIDPTDVHPSEVPGLDVQFDTQLALNWSHTPAKVNEMLNALSQANPMLLPSLSPAVTGLPTQVAQPAQPTNSPLIIGCTPNFCKSGENVNFKLIILAWKAVNPVPCAASPGNQTVKYTLTRTTQPDSGGPTEVSTLVGPVNQPYIDNNVIVVVDIVPIQKRVTYALGSYLVASPSTVTTYDLASCRSPLFKSDFSTGVYDAAFCSTIPAPGVPPYLLPTEDGMCTHNTTQQSQDYYCNFVWPGLDNSKPPGLDVSKLAFYDQTQGKCAYLQPSVTTLSNKWKTQTCNFDDTNYNFTQEEACVTGVKDTDAKDNQQTVTATCSAVAYLQNSTRGFTKSSFATALEKMLEQEKYYNWGNFDSSAIKDLTQQNALWNKQYYRCGPETNLVNWGSDASACGAALDSEECKSLAEMGNCLHNLCDSWRKVSDEENVGKVFTRSRTCFANDAGGVTTCAAKEASKCCGADCQAQKLSPCCNCNGTYEFDPVTHQGSCKCLPRYKGQCKAGDPHDDPCSFAPWQDPSAECSVPPKDGKPPDITGCCRAKTEAEMQADPTDERAYMCSCDPGYFKREANRPMDKFQDCEWYETGTIQSTMYYNGPDNPAYPFNTPMPLTSVLPTAARKCTPDHWDYDTFAKSKFGPTIPVQDKYWYPGTGCTIAPYTCKCPTPAVDPLVCRRNTPKTVNPTVDLTTPAPNKITDYNPETGCISACSAHAPAPGQQFKYANPLVDDYRCTGCSVGGDKCTPVGNRDQSYCDLANCSPTEACYNTCNANPAAKEAYISNHVMDYPYHGDSHFCPDCCFYNCQKKSGHDTRSCDKYGQWH